MSALAGYLEQLRRQSRVLARRSRMLDDRGPADASDSHFDLGRRFGVHPSTVSGQIVFGRVIDGLAGARWYRVQLDATLPLLPCLMLGAGATGAIGARSLSQPKPDTLVLVYVVLQREPYGIILGPLPENIVDPAMSFADQISQQSRAGLQVEEGLQAFFGTADRGGITDWSSGGPTDATLTGENGWISETGLMFFLDSHMLAARASDNCGLWSFLDEQLTRLAGHHLQLRTAAADVDYFDDEGETSIITSIYPYFWEALGAWKYGQPVARRLTSQAAQIDTPEYSVVEPLFNDQQPFARVQRFDGYLGAGGQRRVIVPPVLESDPQPNRFGVDRQQASVFLEHTGLDGYHQIHSAKGILLSKRITLPAPKQRHLPEDETGDTPDGYRASSQLGSGPDTRLVSDPDNSDADYPEQTAAAAAADRHTYRADFEALAAFRAHKKDWQTPDAADLGQMGGQTQAKIDFTVLKTKTYVPAPPVIPIAVDHRNGVVNYLPNNCFLELMDDGGVVFGCGWGARMLFSGGGVSVAAPGDIRLQAGRDLIMEAGSDLILKGRNCLEATTSRGPIRVRAADTLKLKGENVEIHADANVTTRTPTGSFRVWADDVYLRAGIDGEPGAGIVLDAGKGQGVITSYSKTFENVVTQGVFHFVLGTGDVVACASMFSAEGAALGGNLSVAGCIAAVESIYAGSWLVAVAGHVATGGGADFESLVGGLSGTSLTNAQSVIFASALAEATLRAEGDTTIAANYTNCVWASGGAGDDDLIDASLFRFRSTEQYGAAALVTYESRWQQLARLSGAETDSWTEKDENDTYPFPGKEALIEDATLRRVDLTIFDVAAGVGKPTSDKIYQAPAYGAPEKVKLDGAYIVVDASSW